MRRWRPASDGLSPEPDLVLGHKALKAEDPGDRTIQGLPPRRGDLIDPSPGAALADDPVRGDEARVLKRVEVTVDRPGAAPVEAEGPEPLHQLIAVPRGLGEQKEEAWREQLPWTAHLDLEVISHPCSGLCSFTIAKKTLLLRPPGTFSVPTAMAWSARWLLRQSGEGIEQDAHDRERFAWAMTTRLS